MKGHPLADIRKLSTLGIDIAKRRHHACLLDAEGAIVFCTFAFAQRREGFAARQARLLGAGVSPSARQVGWQRPGIAEWGCSNN